jgi:hypothetical protein
MNRCVLESKYCEWCGSSFVPLKGQQSDMCKICWNRYKLYLDSKKRLSCAKQQHDSIVDKYKELALRGCRVPKDLEVKK